MGERWEEERHEENEGQKERGRVGREPERIFKEWHLLIAIHRFSFHPPTRPHPNPLIASCFIFAFWALDNAVTAYRAPELLFEPEVDDGFKWWVAGGVKHGLILCG